MIRLEAEKKRREPYERKHEMHFYKNGWKFPKFCLAVIASGLLIQFLIQTRILYIAGPDHVTACKWGVLCRSWASVAISRSGSVGPAGIRWIRKGSIPKNMYLFLRCDVFLCIFSYSWASIQLSCCACDDLKNIESRVTDPTKPYAYCLCHEINSTL